MTSFMRSVWVALLTVCAVAALPIRFDLYAPSETHTKTHTLRLTNELDGHVHTALVQQSDQRLSVTVGDTSATLHMDYPRRGTSTYECTRFGRTDAELISDDDLKYVGKNPYLVLTHITHGHVPLSYLRKSVFRSCFPVLQNITDVYEVQYYGEADGFDLVAEYATSDPVWGAATTARVKVEARPPNDEF